MCVRMRVPQLQWNFVILSRLFMNSDSIRKGMIVILFWMDLIFEMKRIWIVETIDWITFCFEIVLAIAYNIVQRNHFRSINNRYNTLKTENWKPNQLFYTLQFWKVLKLINSIAIPWKTSESHVKRWLPYVPYSKEKTINNCICCLYGCFFLFVVKKMLAIRFFWVWIFVILKLNTKLTWILKKLHKEWSKNSIKLKAMQYIIVDLGIYSQQKRLH